MNRIIPVPEKLVVELMNYLECCVETNRHDPDDSTPLLAELTMAVTCEVVEIQDTDAYNHVYAIVRYEPEPDHATP